MSNKTQKWSLLKELSHLRVHIHQLKQTYKLAPTPEESVMEESEADKRLEETL